MDAEIVFVAAFKFIKDIVIQNLKKEFKKSKISVKIDSIKDIQWIVTIPAIWDDIAKNKMITWIGKAGLTIKEIKDHCLLKYEPDCASLSLQHELTDETKKNDDKLCEVENKDDIKDNNNDLNGKKYILIDAGGGTVDIACHEFMENNSVKELHYPTGGPWGDMYVDKAFENILHDLLGNELLDSIKNEDQGAYFDLLQNFRKAKMNFEDIGNGKFVSIQLPTDFIDRIDSDIELDKFESKIQNYEYKGHKNCFNFDDDGYLRMNCLIWKNYLYDPLINKVIDHVKELLSKECMKTCDYIYLVGGFSKTPYFNSKICEAFGSNSKYIIDIIIPSQPLFSVVDGAARMGLLNNNKREYVQVRILAKTYGQAIRRKYSDINLDNYTAAFINEHTHADVVDGVKRLYGIFMIYAKKGDAISLNQKLIFPLARSPNHNTVGIMFYSSTKKDPLTIDDGTKLGEYTITWPDVSDSIDITVEITFSEVMNAISYPTDMPELKLETNFNYEWV